MALNKTLADSVTERLRKQKPPKGLVMVLSVTEKQFQNMEIITGSYASDVIDTDKRIVIL